MAGHSKWANIKRKKEAQDKIRGNVFSKISRIITLAVIEGGGIGDPQFNLRLRLAIDKAKSVNMPKDKIAKAIERGMGPAKDQLKEVFYEAFAPFNVSLIIWSTTDNPNRTLNEIRTTLEKHGGKLADQGAASYLFEKCGLAKLSKENLTEERVLQLVEELSALDIDSEGDEYIFYLPFEFLGKARELTKEINFEELELYFKPKVVVSLNDEQKKGIIDLIDDLESLDDVHKVFSNASS